jgi:hypothetical protein
LTTFFAQQIAMFGMWPGPPEHMDGCTQKHEANCNQARMLKINNKKQMMFDQQFTIRLIR